LFSLQKIRDFFALLPFPKEFPPRIGRKFRLTEKYTPFARKGRRRYLEYATGKPLIPFGKTSLFTPLF